MATDDTALRMQAAMRKGPQRTDPHLHCEDLAIQAAVEMLREERRNTQGAEYDAGLLRAEVAELEKSLAEAREKFEHVAGCDCHTHRSFYECFEHTGRPKHDHPYRDPRCSPEVKP